MDRPGALATIGETPIMRLSRLAGPGAAEVWVKLEAANPTGSYKDRMALAMIEGAERRGTLRPGQCVVEYTGGSTGSSLALVCAVKGYPLRIVSSDAFAAEKLQTMARVRRRRRADPEPRRDHARADPGHEAAGGRDRRTGGGVRHRPVQQPRRARRLPGDRRGDRRASSPDRSTPSASYVGVGGCFVGVSEALPAAWPAIERIAVEPAESAVLSGGSPGTHRIEGGGVGFVPPAPDDGRARRRRGRQHGGRVRHGSRGPRTGGGLDRTVGRRQPRRRPPDRRTPRPRPPRGDHPARLGTEVPGGRPLRLMAVSALRARARLRPATGRAPRTAARGRHARGPRRCGRRPRR